MAESESRKSEFAKHVYNAMKKDSNRHQDLRMLKPLIIDSCNASLPRSFLDADTNYREQEDTFHFDIWYLYSYKQLIRILNGEELEHEQKRVFDGLFDYFYSENHSACLQAFSSRLADGKVSNLEITTIMALHYFKPLVPDNVYVIDKCYPFSHSIPVCEFCKEKIIYGDTSIGNCKVWHGKVDILLGTSIVKVNLEKDVKNTNFEENSDDESDDDSSLDSYIEVNSSKDIQNKARSEVLSQAIVNAFYNASKNETLYNQFVPSFFVTEKNIRVILYNCALDILLVSTKMPIWKKEGRAELDLMTLIRVWLALNYSGTMDKRPEEYKFVLENTSTSKFRNLMSDDIYSIYQRDLYQPLPEIERKLSDFVFDSSDEDSYDSDTRAFKLKCLLELNSEVQKFKKI